MKKYLLANLISIFTVFMLSAMVVFANDAVEGNMTSAELLAKSNEKGEITLNENVTISDSLKIDAGNYIIDLNGHTLKFTKDTNLFINGANVTFKNGNINLDGITGRADSILGVGHYGSTANLTFDAVKLQANDYTSPYALIYVYNESTLNIENNSVLNISNEESSAGGVIKASNKAGKINIIDSTLNFEDTVRGFLNGTIVIKNSEVTINGQDNGINSSRGELNLTVDNSKLTITDCTGRALTVDGTNITIKNNSVLDFSNSGEGDIRFKSEGKIDLDKSSELNFKTIKLDAAVNGIELGNLIVSEKYEYKLDEQGNISIVEKPGDTENPGDNTFSDVTGHWAADKIAKAVELGFIKGYPDYTFGPNDTVTREQFAVMLARALSIESEDSSLDFTDRDLISTWAKPAVASAVKAGIIKGYVDGSFAPKTSIKRTELVVMVARAANIDLSASMVTSFIDDSKIPQWSKTAAASLQKLGIINGKGNGEFDPLAKATRAEAVTIILNLLNHLSK